MISLILSIAITLAWDASDPGVTYNLKLGGRSGVYTSIVKTQNTQITLSLPKNTLYYAVVTASRDGLESEPSNEISFVTSKRRQR